jgi:hypothetical protein
VQFFVKIAAPSGVCAIADRASPNIVSTIVSVPGSTLNGVRLRLSIMATEAYIRQSRAVKSFSALTALVERHRLRYT